MKIVKIISKISVLSLFILLNTQEPVLAKNWFHPLNLVQKKAKFNVPLVYTQTQTTVNPSDEFDNAAEISWRNFFSDPDLIHLIDTALSNNQELNVFLQDIEIAKNDVKAAKSEYLPKVGLGFGAENFKISNHSRDGDLDKIIERNKLSNPDALFNLGANLSWEVDIWKKLRNAKNASVMHLMAQREGRNFLISRLVSEIARNYYELMALDNSLKIIDENIALQGKAYIKMKLLKEYAKANNLAVNRFEAQMLKTKSQRFQTSQQIIEKENRLKFLSGIYDATPVLRNSQQLLSMQVNELQIGVPVQLLANRPDIRQAEYTVKAARLELKSVKASLYPQLSIDANAGFSAFEPTLLFNPKALVYDVMGNLMTPLINRQAILAKIGIADAYQTQTVLSYEQTLLQAYTEVLNQMAKIRNMQQSYATKQKEVALLDASVVIANSLFKYAKANYVEVLLTQEEKLNAQTDLVDLKMNLIGSKVDLYRALGGGWR